ncbi:hypothetical protein BDY24DRAFT_433966 [Mrakia frigida]|uniref:glycosyltransferase domain-containing protein n=1 Tax=Mrakia frigida TaxID=29902 RepID=UPI003FCC2358
MKLHQLKIRSGISTLLFANIFLFATFFFHQLHTQHVDLPDPTTLDSVPPRLHFLLPATHSTPEFCKTLLTTLLYDYSPVVTNWGDQERGPKGRLAKVSSDRDTLRPRWAQKADLSRKIKGVHDYIKNNVTSPEDLVFMIDAFDVWMQHPPSTLISKYLTSPPRVLIGADKKCWPPIPECLNLPSSPLPSQIYGDETDSGADQLGRAPTYNLNRPRYPNSGTILSPQSLLLPLYASLLHEVTAQNNPHDDQQLFISAYSLENASPEVEPTIKVDFTSDLFQVMTFSEGDMVFMRGRTYLENPLGGEEERLVWNRVTGTLPSVLHFNGGEKRLLKTWWERMWWITGGEGSEEEREAVKNWVKRKVRKGGVTDAKDGRWMAGPPTVRSGQKPLGPLPNRN